MNDLTIERSASQEQSATAQRQAQPAGPGTKPVAQPTARTQAQDQNDFQTELLIFEGEVRGIQDERELFTHFCNSSRRVLPYRQCFYGKVNKPVSYTHLTLPTICSV